MGGAPCGAAGAARTRGGGGRLNALEVRREAESGGSRWRSGRGEEIRLTCRSVRRLPGDDVVRGRACAARRGGRAELRSEIRALGSVNLDSIEEERTLAARNEDLVRQVADLDAAGRRLRVLIERLNEASRQRFERTFVRVQEEFGGSGGMFRRLFGGGRAEVRLMPLVREVDGERVETDEIDMLESGVEIIAKPPGKEPRSISQLSGGEKTLTAVALLMAIFRSKPSCFCVLDEVDAAWTRGNVAVLQHDPAVHRPLAVHRDHAQQRLMQAADRLYGVTVRSAGSQA